MTGGLHRHRTAGFTLIEVMLVLMIGGLIITMVFLVVPHLQENKRNHVRKNAVDFVSARLGEYRGSNGEYPLAGPPGGSDDKRAGFIAALNASGKPTTDFTIRYVNFDAGETYPFSGADAPATLSEAHNVISIAPGHRCNRDTSAGPGDADYPLQESRLGVSNLQIYAVWILLEGNQVYCVSNDM